MCERTMALQGADARSRQSVKCCRQCRVEFDLLAVCIGGVGATEPPGRRRVFKNPPVQTELSRPEKRSNGFAGARPCRPCC